MKFPKRLALWLMAHGMVRKTSLTALASAESIRGGTSSYSPIQGIEGKEVRQGFSLAINTFPGTGKQNQQLVNRSEKPEERLLNIDHSPITTKATEVASTLGVDSNVEAAAHNQKNGICLVDEDGSFGSTDGDRIPIYFFFQVETVQGTTETQMNGVILDDIEITLVDFLIPKFFNECIPEIGVMSRQPTFSRRGGYEGMTSKPADFVLRGFKCVEGSSQNCFVVSGSMTVFTKGRESGQVIADMRVAIMNVMENGGIETTVSRVTGIELLDDSLNPATLSPPNMMEEPQLTGFPEPKPNSDSPSFVPISNERTNNPTNFPVVTLSTNAPTSVAIFLPPTQIPTTQAPSAYPTEFLTDSPSSTHAMTQSTRAPTLGFHTTIMPSAVESLPFATRAPTAADSASSEPSTATQPPPTNSINFSSTTEDRNQTIHSGPNEATEELFWTAKPEELYVEEDTSSALEKVPVWGWVLVALSVCVCCTYSNPDDDDEDPVVNQNIRAQELAQERFNLTEQAGHEKEKDPANDSEVYTMEYFRKLYRQ